MFQRAVCCILHASHFSGLHALSTVVSHVHKGHLADTPWLCDPYVLVAVTVAGDDLVHLCLVDVVQFGARSSSIIRLFAQPLGPDLDAAAAGLAAAGPVGPLTELAVGGAGDDASFFYVTMAVAS